MPLPCGWFLILQFDTTVTLCPVLAHPQARTRSKDTHSHTHTQPSPMHPPTYTHAHPTALTHPPKYTHTQLSPTHPHMHPHPHTHTHTELSPTYPHIHKPVTALTGKGPTHLADECALASHVGPCDDVEPAAALLHHAVIGHKRYALLHFHTRVTGALQARRQVCQGFVPLSMCVIQEGLMVCKARAQEHSTVAW